MAPPHGDAADAEEAMLAQLEKWPISTVLIVMAMQTEALTLVNRLQLAEDSITVFPEGIPWVRYHGMYKDLNINLIRSGKDPSLGVDSVGTISASLVTYASIQVLQPNLIINAGTAGGIKVFDLYGVGLRQALATPTLAKALNLKVGKLSTGDSVDMSPQDEASIIANDAAVKDMDGAAVAYVADLLKVPAIFVKAVTDIVDGDKPTAEEFLQNLARVTAALDQAMARLVDFVSGRCLCEL